MIFLATNWTTAWLMTGIGIGVVFCILVLLVLILQIFSIVANQEKKQVPEKLTTAKVTPAPTVIASEADKAAVATALYLYYRNVHDEESHVLTIHHDAHNPWHSELNDRL